MEVAPVANTTCAEIGCERPVKTRGLCEKHYARARRNGTLPAKEQRTIRPCAADGCPKDAVGRQDYCNTHYQRIRRNGDLKKRKGGVGAYGGTSTLNCSRCNVAFKASPAQRRRAAEGAQVFCSRDCQKSENLITGTCSHCGSEMTRRRNDVAPTGRMFCSIECRKVGGGRIRIGTEIPCAVCAAPVWVKPSMAATKRYCSVECQRKSQERRETRTCPECGDAFEARLSDQAKFCSAECAHEHRRAKIGDRYVREETGYAWIYVDNGHGEPIKVQEHRWVMEQHLGRKLATWETVHHKTGGFAGRSNNALSNLELWPSRHPRGHRAEDIAVYCREMLALYGTDHERAQYAAHVPADVAEANPDTP